PRRVAHDARWRRGPTRPAHDRERDQREPGQHAKHDESVSTAVRGAVTDEHAQRLGDLGAQPRAVTLRARAAVQPGDRQRLTDEVPTAGRAADGDGARDGRRGEDLAEQAIYLS